MRVRVRFTRVGKVRFTSHRDLARIWERVLRRADIPVARSEGFSPRPRLHFGLALSTGYESMAEYLDVDIVEGAEVDLSTLPARLTEALPRGLAVTAVAPVEPGTPSLQHAVIASRWEIEVHGLDLPSLSTRVRDLLDAPELVVTRQRKGKDVTDDVRPHLLHLQPDTTSDGGVLLVAELATRERGLRPSELVALLGDDVREGLVRRTHQFTEHDGTRTEPLVPGDAAPTAISAAGALAPRDQRPSAPHVQERAS